MKNRAKPRNSSSRKSAQAGSVVGAILGIFVLLILIGVVLYAVYGRKPDNDVTRTDVKQALASVKDASENAVTTSKVKAAFALSKNVSAFDINVDSDNGIVTLRGTVPSEQKKRLAEDIARETGGVKDVRNELNIDPSAKPDPEMQQLGGRVADLELRTKITEAIARNPELKSDSITVEVQNRSVVLRGDVRKADDKYAAERIAWGTDEVKDVHNELTVRDARLGDRQKDELARKVEFELYSTKAFDLQPVQISSHDGVVVLNGQVRSPAEKVLAERIAQDTDGVKGVRNNLTVSEYAPTPNPNAE